MKKLYRVTVEAVVFVLADGETEASDIARGNARDIEFDYQARKVTSASQIDGEWHDERPFTAINDPGYAPEDPTCAQIAAALPGVPK